MNKPLITIAVTALSLAAIAQDKPQDVGKKDLPKLAKCLMCVDEGEEEPARRRDVQGQDLLLLQRQRD